MTTATPPAVSAAQQEYDTLVAALRRYAPYDPQTKQPRTDLGGWDLNTRQPGPLAGPQVRQILEWDAFPFSHHFYDAKDPNIELRVEQEVWVTVVIVVNGQELDGKKRTGTWPIDRKWPASEVANPRANGTDPHAEPPTPPEPEPPPVATVSDLMEVVSGSIEQPRIGGKFVKREP